MMHFTTLGKYMYHDIQCFSGQVLAKVSQIANEDRKNLVHLQNMGHEEDDAR